MKQRTITLLGAVGLALAFSLSLLLIPLAAIAASGSVTHTTKLDFTQSCTVLAGAIPAPVLSNTQVISRYVDAVLLAPVLFDDFNGTTLNTGRWQTNAWPLPGGPYTPTVSGGIITLEPRGRVRSTSTYTQGIMEAVAEFGPGDHQHIGFAENDGLSKYFLFSTYNTTDTLYARVLYPGISNQDISLGSIPTGLHNYRIEASRWDIPNAEVRFYVDNTLVHTSSITTSVPAMYLYLSNDDKADDGISANLRIDQVQVEPPFVASGSYTSCALDAGASNSWQTINWDATLAPSTALTVQTRVSFDGSTWDAWGNVSNGGAIYSSTLARYVQYRLLPSTSNTQLTPVINSVTLNYDTLPAGVIITPTNTNVTEGGATDTYRVWLTTPPAAPAVTINMTTDGQVNVAPTPLTFNALTYNTPQTVTVTAVDDAIVEASPHSGVITHTATSADSNYNNISIPNVAANITDNDTHKVFLPLITK